MSDNDLKFHVQSSILIINARIFSAVLGFDHAHNVHNRDDYVIYMEANLRNSSYAYNFQKSSKEQFSDFGLSYDYSSIMHYSKNAYSKSAELYTLLPRDINYLDKMGQRKAMSYKDIQKINILYRCSLDLY